MHWQTNIYIYNIIAVVGMWLNSMQLLGLADAVEFSGTHACTYNGRTTVTVSISFDGYGVGVGEGLQWFLIKVLG